MSRRKSTRFSIAARSCRSRSRYVRTYPANQTARSSLDASSTLAYRSRTQQFELRTPGLDQPAYALLDANIVYNIDERFSIGVHGKNLTDKQYIVSGYNFLRQNPDTGQFILANGQPGLSSTLGGTGVLTAYYGNPRQVFATFTAKF